MCSTEDELQDLADYFSEPDPMAGDLCIGCGGPIDHDEPDMMCNRCCGGLEELDPGEPVQLVPLTCGKCSEQLADGAYPARVIHGPDDDIELCTECKRPILNSVPGEFRLVCDDCINMMRATAHTSGHLPVCNDQSLIEKTEKLSLVPIDEVDA